MNPTITTYWKKILWLVLFLLMLQLVLGLGLRPARTHLSFEPGYTDTYAFHVINTDHQDISLTLYTEGELADYITFKEQKILLMEDDDSTKVEFTLALPAKLPAGEVIGTIVVEQNIFSNQTVNARIILKHKVVVAVPYPEKYVKGQLMVKDVGDNLALITEVENFGQQPIQEVTTTFFLNNEKQQLQAAETPIKKLSVGTKEVFKTEIPKTPELVGEFDLLAKVTYDGQILELEQKVSVGEPDVDIVYFDRFFTQGVINKFTISVLNNWNKIMENILLEVFVQNEGKNIDIIPVKPLTVAGGETKSVEGYLNAQNWEEGKYTFDVVASYNGKRETTSFEGMIVSQQKTMAAKDLPEEKNDDNGMSLQNFILIVGIVLVLATLIVVLLLIYRKKSEQEEF